jgi:hypothetical protein
VVLYVAKLLVLNVKFNVIRPIFDINSKYIKWVT